MIMESFFHQASYGQEICQTYVHMICITLVIVLSRDPRLKGNRESSGRSPLYLKKRSQSRQ